MAPPDPAMWAKLRAAADASRRLDAVGETVYQLITQLRREG